MKFTLGLLLGAAVGAVVVHYLNTTEGKALVSKVKKDAGEMGDNLTEFTDDLVQKGKSLMGNHEKVDEEPVVEETVVFVVPG
jgi:gas vesicle protein